MSAKSQSQQRLFGMVHACQQDKSKCSSEKVKDMSKKIKPKDVEDFAKTKHEGLPEKKEKKYMTFEGYILERDKELNEEGTSTADVAHFMRPISPIVRRQKKQKKSKE